MSENNLQNINIKIGSRSYPVKVEPAEVASLHEVEKTGKYENPNLQEAI